MGVRQCTRSLARRRARQPGTVAVDWRSARPSQISNERPESGGESLRIPRGVASGTGRTVTKR
jgi:hypothetical protein